MATFLEIYAIGAVLVSLAVWRGLGADGPLSWERVETAFVSALVWPLALAVGLLYAVRTAQVGAEREAEKEAGGAA